MEMYNPPHIGQVLSIAYLEPLGLSTREAAEMLQVHPSTLSRILNKKARMSADLAVRFEKVFGMDAGLILRVQQAHELWQVRHKKKIPALTPHKCATEHRI